MAVNIHAHLVTRIVVAGPAVAVDRTSNIFNN
jgi:hypothetical protein